MVESLTGYLQRWRGDYRAPLAFCITLLVFAAAAHLDFHMADEGYLWYGAERVQAGEIPMRDFMSYDPGRYYLSALALAIGGPGPVTLNLCLALVAAFSAWLACRLLFRGPRTVPVWLYVLLLASLILWLVPRVKSYDIAASVVLVAALAWLLEVPSLRRCFLNGLVLGLVAIVGRNHGLYGAVADVAALGFMAWVERRAPLLPSAGAWALGLVVGYAPMWLAALMVPGFWTALWSTIHIYFEVGNTNTPLPIPWPWRVLGHADSAQGLLTLLHGCLLLVMPLFGLAVAAYGVCRARAKGERLDPVLLAAGLLTIPYTHHALARADVSHLVQAMLPLFIGIGVLVAGLPRVWVGAAAVAVLGLSAAMALPLHEPYQAWTEGDWRATKVGPDTLRLPPDTVREVGALTGLVRTYAPAGQEFVALPILTGAYAMADRRAAVWDTYPLFPADAATEDLEIARLQAAHPAFLVLKDLGPHNRYGYAHTHPRVYAYLMQNFTPAASPELPPGSGLALYLPAPSGRPVSP